VAKGITSVQAWRALPAAKRRQIVGGGQPDARVKVKIYGQTVRVSPAKAARLRARKQQLRGALYDPMATLSGPSLQQAAKQITNLQYQPQLHALDRSSATVAKQGDALAGRSMDYYHQLAADAQTGIDRTTALTQRAVGDVQQAGAVEQGRLEDVGNVTNTETAADAQTRGTGLQFGERAKEELAAAKAAAAARSGTEQAATSQYGANFADVQNAMAGTLGLRAGERDREIGNTTGQQAGADLMAQRQDLQSQRATSTRRTSWTSATRPSRTRRSCRDSSGIRRRSAADAQARIAQMQFQAQQQRQAQRHAMEVIRLQAKLNRKGKLSPKEQARLDFLWSGVIRRRKASSRRSCRRVRAVESGKARTSRPPGRSPTRARPTTRSARSSLRTTARRIPDCKVGSSWRTSSRRGPALPEIKDPKTGEVVQWSTPAVPPLPPEAVRAAMDLIYDKHLSKGTRAALRARYPGLYRKLIKAGYKGPTGRSGTHPARPGGPSFSGPHG
jgi:hypothetical protein